MIRRATAMWILLAVFAGAGLFLVKHQVSALEGRLTHLDRAILQNQRAVHVLKAEWSFLNQPARLEDLGRRLLGLQARRGERIISVNARTALSEPAIRIGDWIAPARASMGRTGGRWVR